MLFFLFPNPCPDAMVNTIHANPRLPGMDPSVWEVNFNHREDAVNALMVS